MFEEHFENFSFSSTIEQCLEKMQQSVRCILIVSGTMGLIHMPTIFKLAKVSNLISVIVFCYDVEGHKKWTRDYPELIPDENVLCMKQDVVFRIQ